MRASRRRQREHSAVPLPDLVHAALPITPAAAQTAEHVLSTGQQVDGLLAAAKLDAADTELVTTAVLSATREAIRLIKAARRGSS